MYSSETCDWIVARSDDKLARLNLLGSKAKAERYRLLVRMVRQKASHQKLINERAAYLREFQIQQSELMWGVGGPNSSLDSSLHACHYSHHQLSPAQEFQSDYSFHHSSQHPSAYGNHLPMLPLQSSPVYPDPEADPESADDGAETAPVSLPIPHLDALYPSAFDSRSFESFLGLPAFPDDQTGEGDPSHRMASAVAAGGASASESADPSMAMPIDGPVLPAGSDGFISDSTPTSPPSLSTRIPFPSTLACHLPLSPPPLPPPPPHSTLCLEPAEGVLEEVPKDGLPTTPHEQPGAKSPEKYLVKRHSPLAESPPSSNLAPIQHWSDSDSDEDISASGSVNIPVLTSPTPAARRKRTVEEAEDEDLKEDARGRCKRLRSASESSETSISSASPPHSPSESPPHSVAPSDVASDTAETPDAVSCNASSDISDPAVPSAADAPNRSPSPPPPTSPPSTVPLLAFPQRAAWTSSPAETCLSEKEKERMRGPTSPQIAILPPLSSVV
ncbi:hypothetical protein BDK51DRAFT_28269 [Blyttiomyces helicus]|uniref:Uncharacterized protein n=1 Tax=Blyttiomyces helicus TaxID=388810 RepID=A0A4P9W0X3_9FUNG|nr:hypothetical protein BDK51DRAFT_28269 [Blyttiomyces helicus]|eukprot:RKO85282.1 hypothetical protein BDK51DRAFT_28269 [Blyttiomyces helicus]